MRRLILFFYLALVGVCVNAQVVEFTPITGNLDAFNNQLFEHVDLTQVPTGFLLDRSIALTDPQPYNGRTALSASTDLDLSKFSLLYGILQGAAINNTVLPAAQTYLSNSNVPSGSNALLLLANRMSFIDADALSNNLFSVQNSQLYDVANRTRSPYITDTLFAATCTRYDFSSLNVSFTLPTDRIISNFNAPVANFTVDWGNGQGSQSYTAGQTLTVNYPTSGQKLITLSYAASNGRMLQTRFAINITLPINVLTAQLRDLTPPCLTNFPNYAPNCSREDFMVNSIKSFEGSTGSAKVTIFYASNDMQLRKPLIVLDGFEPDAFENSSTAKSVLSLVSFNFTPNNNELGIDFKSEGYDLIFVDWSDGRTFLQRNAFVLEEVLKEINRRKALSGCTEKNVMIGVSMGGVIGKFALRDLEIENPNAANGGHDVRKYITFDAPMQGANIPLGMQYLLDHLNFAVDGFSLRNVVIGRNGKDVLAGALTVINSPAARQLLLEQRVASLGSPVLPNLNPSFFATLNGMGALQKCEIKNISNGSLLRTDIFGAGSEILNAILIKEQIIPQWWGFIRQRFTASVRVKSVGPNSVVYEGEFSIKGSGGYTNFFGIVIRPNGLIKTGAKVTMSSRPSLVTDHAAGGMTSLGIDLLEPLRKQGAIVNILQPNFCFIPVWSSLGIPKSSASTSGDLTQMQQVITSGLTESKGYMGSKNIGTAGSAPSAINPDIAVRSSTDTAGNPTVIITGPNNQIHVSMSFRVSAFLLNELTGSRSILSQGNNSIVSNRTYNYGFKNGTPPIPVNNAVDFPLIVQDRGQLWVNRSGKIEFADVTSNPNNLVGIQYNLIIGGSSCTGNGQLLVRNGGFFNIGEAPNNVAIVQVIAGGKLTIGQNGVLKIENGSQITVENGGKLII